MAAPRDEFKDFVLDQLANLRGVLCRGMFGGYGLYCGQRFFGIIHKSRLYFKVSPTTQGQYDTMGMKPFRPNATQTLTFFYEVPLEILEDGGLLPEWAQEAIAVAGHRSIRRPAAKKKGKRPASKPSAFHQLRRNNRRRSNLG